MGSVNFKGSKGAVVEVIKGLRILLGAGVLWTTCSSASTGDTYENAQGLTFIKLPAGAFTMGTIDLNAVADELEDGNVTDIQDERPSHEVTFQNPIWMGKTEVTQGQWFDVMQTKPGPDSHWVRDDWRELPVVSISWEHVQDFIQRLNELDSNADYRLPTEAEWEYAARAGSRHIRPFPLDELGDHAWYIETSGDVPQPVAQLKPNAWGLYDTLGNAWEWVADWYASKYYQFSRKFDPQGPKEGSRRVRRGGSYHCPAKLVRPGYRAATAPDRAFSVLGFRLVAEPNR